MYFLIRSLLFCFSAEFSHRFVLKILPWFYSTSTIQKIQRTFPHKPKQVFKLNFPNPVGLAAGLDKNGACIDALYGLGFGFIEVGAVTPRPQPGNPKPRLFRLPKVKALINQLGFNNAGVDHLVSQLKKRKISGILGVNIGKNFDTPLENALKDYQICYEKVYPYADFVTLNVSSPNTAGLRELQGERYLLNLLTHMKQQQYELQKQYHKYVPLLVKISPDLDENEIQTMAKIFLLVGIDGIIAVNTTKDRTGVSDLKYSEKSGGLSGKPLFSKTLSIIRQLHEETEGQIPLIAVGGIMSPVDALTLLNAGASLVQIYTGLIYEGPKLVREIVESLK